MTDNLRMQRILVLQGGGALGAYEAGSILELVECIINADIANNQRDRQVFDIVAGTSIGAINGSILVSQYLEKRKEGIDVASSWRVAAQKLVEFWKYLSCPTPDIKKILENYEIEPANGTSGIASVESVRRYYAAMHFLSSGLEKVFSKPVLVKDTRFSDKSNIWYRYNNDGLRDSLKRFANFPISTSFDKKEPRLLVISVDVQEGETVTFDSYAKPDGVRKTEYGYDKNTGAFENTIEYSQGLTAEHIIASSAVPGFYDFEEIQGHKFWDGILLSNTPLREALDAHRAFWEHNMAPSNEVSLSLNENSEFKVPDLEVYVVTLYPKKEMQVPYDYDSVKDRIQNITNCDKTTYEEIVSKTHNDLLDVIQKIVNLAIENGLEKDIKVILDKPAQSKHFAYLPWKSITYQDLLNGIFGIKVIRIERKDDEHSVWSKFTDFTDITINRLLDEGKKDTKDVLERHLH
jgi:predicted acylesterase/phospholipase RssA